MRAATRARGSVGRRFTWILLTPGVLAISAGCLSLEQMAPPVGPEFTAASRGRSIPPALLEQGRHVYLTDCTRCHSIEPIGRYSVRRWEEIVVRMAAESKLDESRTVALRAYVLTAHDVLARRALQKTGT